MKMPGNQTRRHHAKKKSQPVVLDATMIRVKLNNDQYHRLITPAYSYWQSIMNGNGNRIMLYEVAVRIQMLYLATKYINEYEKVSVIAAACHHQLEKLNNEYMSEYMIRVDERTDQMILKGLGLLEQATNLLSRKENFTNYNDAVKQINERRIFGSFVHE